MATLTIKMFRAGGEVNQATGCRAVSKIECPVPLISSTDDAQCSRRCGFAAGRCQGISLYGEGNQSNRSAIGRTERG